MGHWEATSCPQLLNHGAGLGTHPLADAAIARDPTDAPSAGDVDVAAAADGVDVAAAAAVADEACTGSTCERLADQHQDIGFRKRRWRLERPNCSKAATLARILLGLRHTS